MPFFLSSLFSFSSTLSPYHKSSTFLIAFCVCSCATELNEENVLSENNNFHCTNNELCACDSCHIVNWIIKKSKIPKWEKNNEQQQVKTTVMVLIVDDGDRKRKTMKKMTKVEWRQSPMWWWHSDFRLKTKKKQKEPNIVRKMEFYSLCKHEQWKTYGILEIVIKFNTVSYTSTLLSWHCSCRK